MKQPEDYHTSTVSGAEAFARDNDDAPGDDWSMPRRRVRYEGEEEDAADTED